MIFPKLPRADRKTLLLGTALASTLLLATVTAPTTAHAVDCDQPDSPDPINDSVGNAFPITCVNTVTRAATAANQSAIDLETETSPGSFIDLNNSGTLSAFDGDGIHAFTNTANSRIDIINSGDVSVFAAPYSSNGRAIRAYSDGGTSPVDVFNTGDLDASLTGIYAKTQGGNVDVFNSGHITRVTDGGIQASVGNAGNAPGSVSVTNIGDIDMQSGTAISAQSYGTGSPVDVFNSGALSGGRTGILAGSRAGDSRVDVVNTGDILAVSTMPDPAMGINAFTGEPDSPIEVINSGSISATSSIFGAFGIRAGAPASVSIMNSGSVFADGSATRVVAGIYTYDSSGTTIVNSGDIGASSNLAIAVTDGPVDISNTGTITGFVRLGADDTFVNRSGGVFEARQLSNFDAYGASGTDLFINKTGGTVHAINLDGAPTRFVSLDRFENAGLISTVDGTTDDEFVLSNTPDGTDHTFVGAGGSTLALDAFLGGPGAPADKFIIQGDASGVTAVQINNTNPGGGTFNPTGIPVIFVNGATPNPNAFYMQQPADAGFFDYDIFFVPTGSGHWELRSAPGGGAHLLPQLTTAAQDIWHQGSSTWFDRTADLRVLLAGGVAPIASDPGGNLGAPVAPGLTPAVWARGSGSWLDRDGAASTTAYGRTYRYDLDRDLDTFDVQMGLDLGRRDLWSPGDALVFGLLGGFVHGDLDYDTLVREFDFDGGQVGAYATYLRGGLFVDTLLNAHLYELDPNGARGFPSSLDATTIGLRTDTGYRFGSFTGGPFLEPLATLEVLWADIDGFSQGANTVSFDDDADVRGRVGLRAGTTMQAWQNTVMEPFVTGSLWGSFTGDNRATLVSNGATFRLADDLDDVWGEVSAGVNLFDPAAGTAMFAKADVTFGDDVTGVGGKAGMRVAW